MLSSEVREAEVRVGAVGASRAGLRWVWVVWWLVPVLGAGCVLLASYSALSERRYSRANGVTGELLAGHSVGQSFVARYDDLAGVELWLGTYGREGPARASLVVHLREYPGAGPDLATARLMAGQVIGENPWQLFSFPPIAGSQDKEFYVEVESPDGKQGAALTLFRWESTVGDDPYAQGAAFVDGSQRAGDMAFGLIYSASPVGAWEQMARAATAIMPVGLMVAGALAGLLVGVWVVAWVPRMVRDPMRWRRWLGRWALPLALLVALGHGGLYMFLVPPWQGPDEHAHFTYLALLYAHGLDDGAVQRLEWWGKDRDAALERAVGTSMDRYDFSRLVSWDGTPGASTSLDLSSYQELRQPAAYYWLCAGAIAASRAIGLHVDPYANPENALLVARGVSVLLSLGVVALAWVAARLLAAREAGREWLWLLLPLTVALLPMHAFAGAMANNDVLAELAVSALFVALVALLRWPGGLRGVGLVLVAVWLAWVSGYTKSTAPAASVPLLGLGLLVWVGMVGIAYYVLRRGGRAGGAGAQARTYATRNTRYAIGVALAVAVLVGLVAVPLVAYEPEAAAAGWQYSYWPVKHAARVRTEGAKEGSYVLMLRAP
ncbi:MAG: hypothetical protein ACJ78Q_18245, partial [Chloroflexia bacterium]